MRTRRLLAGTVAIGAVSLLLSMSSAGQSATDVERQPPGAAVAAAATGPNLFIYNLDDLRDLVPQGVDPLEFMPEVRSWMHTGTRYLHSFVADPTCCPSRAAMMTGRYPHSNGVRLQADGPRFDHPHSMACYLQSAGYSTYMVGKFLTTWPKTSTPPCFSHSTVMWSGYRNVQVRVDGVSGTAQGYSTTYLGARGRSYVQSALQGSAPFLLYEAPQAPHWVKVTEPDGTVVQRAVPEARYADADVGSCSGPPEVDRSDKPKYVRNRNHTAEQAQVMCASQLRAIMTADDEFGATMQLLADRGVLDDTLVVFTSDNGYFWGEHGWTEKFLPYEPSVRVPLLVRWPDHIAAGTDATRLVTNLDVLPTIMEAAGIAVPAGGPALEGESLLRPSRRTTVFAEYYLDPANGKVSTWKMVRTNTAKYIHTYNADGGLIFTEYYDLTADPIENVNLLRDGNPSNDPPAAEVTALRTRLQEMSTCTGGACVR